MSPSLHLAEDGEGKAGGGRNSAGQKSEPLDCGIQPAGSNSGARVLSGAGRRRLEW